MPENYLIIPELTDEEIQRFWSKVSTPNENGCRLWLGGRDEDGYGVFGVRRNKKKQNYRAHRVAYFLQTNEQPNNLLVCHNCPNGDIPACTTREHLFLGTALDNNRDTKIKGRMATGDKHGSHTHPECWARGDRHGSKTHPEKNRRGSNHGGAKFTEVQVLEIRQRYKNFKTSSYVLAKEFHVSQGVIMQILHRKTWKHI